MDNPLVIALVAAAVVAALGAAIKWGLPRALRWLRKELIAVVTARPPVPDETLRLVPVRAVWRTWPSKSGEGLAMEAHLWATNIADRSVTVPLAVLVRRRWTTQTVPQLQARRANGGARMVGQQRGATDHIEPDDMVRATVRFSVSQAPGFVRAGRSISATLVMVDQFGNEHRVRRLKFRPPPSGEPA